MSAPFDPASIAAELSATQQMIEFIYGRINFERLPAERYDLHDFKLSRMRELLARLGDPQRGLPAVHIAGTKGKGSTAAMTAAILSAAGYRVGLFTSPHMADLRERMTVNGELATEEQIGELMTIVPPVLAEMDQQQPSLQPTFFECITAMAWVHFLKCEVDLVVLEVGLGGRLDATNVCTPLVTAITNISHDHERLLGRTLAHIAAEKAGIIKPAVPLLSGVTRPEPQQVIREIAAAHAAPLFEIDRELHCTVVSEAIREAAFREGEAPAEPHFPRERTARREPRPPVLDRPSEPQPVRRGAAAQASHELSPLVIQTQSPWGAHRLRVPLPGRHQARNTLLAVSICDLLAQERFVCPAAAIERGLAEMRWPLRIEVLRRRPLVIVDAAHNDDSIDALVETLSTVSAAQRRLVFGTSKDKNTADLLRRLNANFDEVILTQYVGNPRAVPVDVLASTAAECLSIPFLQAAAPPDAWRLVSQRAAADDLICVTGSFFLAAEMRAVILADER
jgi:dihydrofolate synthase/folylpolyglutamate synthase